MQTNSYSDLGSLPKHIANINTHDETCALLNHEQSPPSLESQTTKPSKDAPTPLPLAQLACLCLVRMCEPINFTHIFPYVNQMLVEMNVTDDLSRVGFYSGLVESAFAVAQLFSIYQWARLSGAFPVFLTCVTADAYVSPDIIGRRPVIFSKFLEASTVINALNKVHPVAPHAVGILGMGIASLVFGLSRTLAGVILARCFGQFFPRCSFNS